MWQVIEVTPHEPWKPVQEHIVPLYDIGPHTCSIKCHCKPTLDEDDVVTHRAFDQRPDAGWFH
jgi:hypothetical protein